MMTFQSEPDVLIVGGGLAGLACARHLHEQGISFQLLEASDAVGGRVRTDHVAGFLLDRGFQVLLTAYPEAQRVLDYSRLDLHAFYHGALIRLNQQSYRVADPFRDPLDAFESLFTPIGTLMDKLRLLRLRQSLRSQSLEKILQGQERTTLEALHEIGFSPSIVSTFFRPFLAGIFLEKELKTSSRMFEFVFKMFSTGLAALPAQGMGAIPAQLAESLPSDAIQLNARVRSISNDLVTLESGKQLKARAVVVATEGPEAARLVEGIDTPSSSSTTCLYYVAEQDPLGQPILVLNGDGTGLINNLCVLSNVAPSYAQPGSSLISVTVLGSPPEDDKTLEGAIRTQLKSWFGLQVNSWRNLRTYRILHALPKQASLVLSEAARPIRIRRGLYVCGDHRDTASIQGALVSGRRAAETIIQDLGS